MIKFIDDEWLKLSIKFIENEWFKLLWDDKNDDKIYSRRKIQIVEDEWLMNDERKTMEQYTRIW
jgi:hypothetical protein